MLNATHSIYDVLNKATDEIQQTTSATQGTINIGVLASIEDHVFEDFAIKYYEANPNVIISLHMLTRKEIWERLENNRIDLAVMYLPDESIKNWKPYQSKKIIQDELLFISGDEKLAKKKRIKFKDTTLNPWVTYPENYYLDQVVKESYKTNWLICQRQSPGSRHHNRFIVLWQQLTRTRRYLIHLWWLIRQLISFTRCHLNQPSSLT